jgi:hypothetical protein
MKAYIVCIRAYNDLDNMAPIVYYLASTNVAVFVCLYYDNGLLNAPQIRYIVENCGANVRIFASNEESLGLWPPGQTSYRQRLSNVVRRLLGRVEKPIMVSRGTVERWIGEMGLDGYDRVVVMVDRTVNRMLEWVRHALVDRDVVVVSCPHGAMTNTNRMIYNTDLMRARGKEEGRQKYDGYVAFDYVLFTDYLELEFDRLHGVVPEGFEWDAKARILGSIRYAPEWLKHTERFSRPVDGDTEKRKTVVFFTKKQEHNVWMDEFWRTLTFLGEFPEIRVLVKPHTRGMKLSRRRGRLPGNVRIVDDAASGALIDAADAILFYGGTSIVLEALMKGKVVACVDYLDANRNVYEYLGACHVTRCRDELKQFLEAVVKQEAEPKPVDRALEEMVYARDPVTPVSKRYVDFFEAL